MYTKIQDIREQAGFQYKERSEEIGVGNDTNKIFYTANKPIVDSNYDDVADKTDIKVYVDGVSKPIDTIDPVLGKITLVTAPAQDKVVTCDSDWSNVEDSMIVKYQAQANNLIDSHLTEVYQLPLDQEKLPELIVLIEKQLSAGLLLDKEYSVGGDETEDSRGRRWVKWAMGMLKMIVDGKITLLDTDGEQIPYKTSGQSEARGYPDDTTKDKTEEESGGKIAFRRKKEF